MRRVVLFCALLALAGCGAVEQKKEAPAAADSLEAEPAVPDTSSEGGL